MTRDPFYRKIMEALATRLDPTVFESAAADLLRTTYPALVPVPGGSDDGMDGAIGLASGSPIPLICTTSTKVSMNLRSSLKAYKAKGHTAHLAVSATSQALTRKRMNTLQRVAAEEGFHLLGIHERTDMANRLYRSPRWSMELLDLAGNPPALSALSSSSRPASNQPMIGRDEHMHWLRTTPGDLLLSGHGGSGKTFLLRQLTDDALFVASHDLGQIAQCIRELTPGALLVDDAHLRLDLLPELRRLREEIGADFRIIADCWPGARDDVAAALMLGKKSCRDLPLLGRKQIVEVIKGVGLTGPALLLSELVNQASGRPGLAVTLAFLCLVDGVEEIALGAALARDIRQAFRPLVGEDGLTMLAAFSVGGRGGMAVDAVAAFMGKKPAAIRHEVAQLAAGGVVTELSDGILRVRPRALACALLRDIFFHGPPRLDITELLTAVRYAGEATSILVEARARGAIVPDDLLRPRLTSAQLLHDYAGVGPTECEWVLARHPQQLLNIASPALCHLPHLAIPMLMEAGQQEVDALNLGPAHPLRRIAGWVDSAEPASAEVVLRRSIVIDAVENWMRAGKDATVAVKVIAAALSLRHETTEQSPEDRRTITLRHGVIAISHLDAMRKIWKRLLTILPISTLDNFEPLQHAIHQYVFPYGHKALPPAYEEACHTLAREMLVDLSRLAAERPGIQSQINVWAIHLGMESPSQINAEYDAIYPPEHVGRAEDCLEQQECHAAAATSLAQHWQSMSPEDVARRLARHATEAAAVGIKYPSWSDYVCRSIAMAVPDPERWAEAFLEASAPSCGAAAFLAQAAILLRPAWEELCRRFLQTQRYRPAGIEVAICVTAASDALIDDAMMYLPGASDALRIWCSRGAVPERQLRRLLCCPDATIAGAAAIGVWHGYRDKELWPCIEADWRQAVLNSSNANVRMIGIFGGRPDLAWRWLIRRFAESSQYLLDEYNFNQAIDALDEEYRRLLVADLPTTIWSGEMVVRIIGADLEAYRLLLGRTDARHLHLLALHGDMNDHWLQKAMLALDAGHDPEDIAEAPQGNLHMMGGKESDYWQKWADKYARLNDHPDLRIREVGRIGAESAQRCRENAANRELEEAERGEHE